MENRDFINSIDIGEDGISDTPYQETKDKLSLELDFYASQLEKGIIDEDNFTDIKEKIEELLKDHDEGVEELNKEVKELKDDLRKETGIELSKEKWILDTQLAVYEELGINRYTYKNGTWDRFWKGIVDGLIIDNAEIANMVMEQGFGIILTIINEFSISDILETMGDSVWDLATGNAYKRGQAAAEIGLVTGGVAGITKLTINTLKKRPKINPEQLAIEKSLDKIEKGIDLSPEEVDGLIRKIDTNNPIYSILEKLTPGSEYQTLIFTGVKGVNDTYSQAFTDSVLNKFKNQVQRDYPGVEVSWDDYKNFVIKTSDAKVTPESQDLQKLLQELFEKEHNSLSKGEKAKVAEKLKHNDVNLGVLSEKGIIEGTTQEDVLLSLAKTRSKLEAEAMGGNIMSKQELIDEEIALNTKYSYTSPVGEAVIDSRGRTKYTVDKGILYKEFSVGGRDVTVPMSIMTSGLINPEILSMVRKGHIPSDMQLYKDIKEIAKASIVHGEFISPIPHKKHDHLKPGEIIPQSEIRNYSLLKERLRNGDINEEALKGLREATSLTYKNALDKETFYSRIRKPGELFFIDIKDMGTINLNDFSDKINKYLNGEIAEKDVFLQSGSLMTKRFQNFITDLKTELDTLYPGKKVNIYIGGDEISFFVEGVKDGGKTTEVVKSINEKLNTNNLTGRTTSRVVKKTDLSKGGEKLLEGIDKLTNYSKMIEKRFSEMFGQIALIPDLMLRSQKTIDLSYIKDFDIRFNKKGKPEITFHMPEGFFVYGGENTFPLDDIIDIKSQKLKGPPSPLIEYFRNNKISRSSINNS